MGAAHYRYVFSTLRDETVIAEIPLYGTYMDLELNAGGQFNGTFQLDMTGKRNEDLIAATVPGRTFVVVERNDVPIWAGYIWARTYQSQAKVVQLFGESFEKFPNHQIIDVDTLLVGEQRNLFRTLWTDMQSRTGSNININVPSSFSTVVSKVINIDTEDLKTYGDAISSIADATNGFDWYVNITKSGQYYIKNLVVGYPTLGAPINNNSLIFEYPGSIVNYYATESMSEAGTNVFISGAGEGTSMLLSIGTNDTMISSGWPRWDVAFSRKDITSSFALSTFAAQETIKRRPPMLTLKPSLIGYAQPEFGSFGLGDTCKVVINDSRFPTALQQEARIVKWALRPGESSNTEEYQVVFEGDEDG